MLCAVCAYTGWIALNFDGTDWLVLLTIILVIVGILTLLALIWPKWKRRRSGHDATLIYQMPADSGKNIDTIPDPRAHPRDEFDRPPRGPTNSVPPPAPFKLPARKVEEPTPVTDLQTSESPKPKRRKSGSPPSAPARGEWVDLIDETAKVPAGYGQHWASRLALDEGDEIRGTLTEVDDDDFSYMVLDEANYAAFRGGDDYEVVDEAGGTCSVRVDFSVDEADRYYLVLYAYGKQNDREVEVSLRKRTGSS